MDSKQDGAPSAPQAPQRPCAQLAKLFEALPQVPLEEVPQIDLYMDQVTTLIEQRMDWMRRNPGDKLLTKTMINNYTKDGVLPPPEKKKYSPRHLVDILLVYHLKQVLSIQDIGRLLGGMHQLPDQELFALYDLSLIHISDPAGAGGQGPPAEGPGGPHRRGLHSAALSGRPRTILRGDAL